MHLILSSNGLFSCLVLTRTPDSELGACLFQSEIAKIASLLRRCELIPVTFHSFSRDRCPWILNFLLLASFLAPVLAELLQRAVLALGNKRDRHHFLLLLLQPTSTLSHIMVRPPSLTLTGEQKTEDSKQMGCVSPFRRNIILATTTHFHY